ncbi:MAG: hypothetical protein JO247_05350 [Chloroflexi bacterium]|nr:hypothetical protein [Chloroflexota bacterium]
MTDLGGLDTPMFVHSESKDELLENLAAWETRQAGFADARLTVLAVRRQMPVCSPNRRASQGVVNSFP